MHKSSAVTHVAWYNVLVQCIDVVSNESQLRIIYISSTEAQKIQEDNDKVVELMTNEYDGAWK